MDATRRRLRGAVLGLVLLCCAGACGGGSNGDVINATDPISAEQTATTLVPSSVATSVTTRPTTTTTRFTPVTESSVPRTTRTTEPSD
ncbi:MAG: hypothetical protein M3314_13660 [Actinomycetota bacterium]|nr:hypothetical protein [Actinomycetota bacterium]